MTTHHVPDFLPCPVCGAVLDAAGPTTREAPNPPPQPGDMTVCVYCLTVLAFGPGYYTRVDVDTLTPDARAGVEYALRFARAMQAVKQRLN